MVERAEVGAGVADAPVTAAETPVYLAVVDEVADVTGAYFRDCRRTDPAPAADDEELARRLWDLSERLVDRD